MIIDLLKDICTSIAGEKAKNIVDLLYRKKKVNEFVIAKKLKITVNQARNILYKLADEGIVSFTKKKDQKKGGWYTYDWTFQEDKGMLKLEQNLFNTISALQHKIQSKKTERFFACPNGDMEMNEENALINNYICTECGEILQLKDNIKEISSIEKDINKAQEDLNSVRAELSIFHQKQEKLSAKKRKYEEHKKKAEKTKKKNALRKKKIIKKKKKK